MYKIQMRRDKARNWTDNDPILADGEPGYEKDTGRFKIGDGVAPWSRLPYFYAMPKAPKIEVVEEIVQRHVDDPTPHPAYDDMPSLRLLFESRLR